MKILRIRTRKDLQALERRLRAQAAFSPADERKVAGILAGVRRRGDSALLQYARRFDGFKGGADDLRLGPSDLRAAYARYPSHADVSALVTELLALSPRFAALWSECEVAERRPMVKRFVHPLVGPLEFTCQVLSIADTDQRLIVYVAEPESETEVAFRRLASMDGAPAL